MWILNGSKACRRFTDKTWHDQLTERDNLAGVESPWRHCLDMYNGAENRYRVLGRR